MLQEQILSALSNVQEPDLGKDLVTLNMIKDIVINDNNVSFTLVLTTPACPMKDMMRNACENVPGSCDWKYSTILAIRSTTEANSSDVIHEAGGSFCL